MINETAMMLLEALGNLSDGDLTARDNAADLAHTLGTLLEEATLEELEAVCVLQGEALREEEVDGERMLVGDFQVQCDPDLFEEDEDDGPDGGGEPVSRAA